MTCAGFVYHYTLQLVQRDIAMCQRIKVFTYRAVLNMVPRQLGALLRRNNIVIPLVLVDLKPFYAWAHQ